MKENKIKYIRVRVTKKMKDEFDIHCKKHFYKPSLRLRAILKKELNGEIK